MPDEMDYDKPGLLRWPLALLPFAVIFPFLIFAALQIGFGYQAERRSYEAATLAKADAIMAGIDGDAERTKASARALATAVSIRNADWRQADQRAREIAALNPDWKSVRLEEPSSGATLFDTAHPFAVPGPALTLQPAVALQPLEVRFGNVRRGGSMCPCIPVSVQIARNGIVRYVLTVMLDPVAVQHRLLRQAPGDSTSAVVDPHAHFIARNRDYSRRLGGLATSYVQDAVRRGGRGIYSSVTYEGLVSYTAYSTSTLTGWSTHIAVPSARVDAPAFGARIATLSAVAISLLLAAALVWVALRMIATQRKADLRVQQAQRLEAVGKMTGGIAHDFNNMLAIVIGSLDLARRRIALGQGDVARYIDNALDGANRAADLTRRLLAFSRRQSLSPAVTDVNAVLTDMTELLRRTLGEAVRLRYDLSSELWFAFIDPGQFENAVINLAVNARDAMPSGGDFSISTENTTFSTTQADDLDLPSGDYLHIRVTDTGSGMNAETLKRAFEPFFTTKEVGKGTGLGLSQIYGFIDQSAGRVVLASEEGLGTSIDIFLPRYHGDLPDEGVTDHAVQAVPTGTPAELILVVEDEDQVRQTTVEALRELGYSVRHAASGAQALEMLASGLPVSLLFTDIVMPGMTGVDLARAARARATGLRLLFATGFERDDDLGELGGDVLRKPFAFDQLARKIRETLDA